MPEETLPIIDTSRPQFLDDWIKAVEKTTDKDDMIRALLPCGETMMITGGPYVGKSLEVQNLTCQFPIGGSYHGLKVKKCHVAYITWEGSKKGLAKRFGYFLPAIPHEDLPLIYKPSHPIFFNTKDGVAEWEKVLTEIKSLNDAKVLIIDSFTYTVLGDTKQDNIMNSWWANVQSLSSKHNLTFIFTWELTKPVLFHGEQINQFDLSRVKTNYSSVYKINTVVGIFEADKIVRDGSEVKRVRTHSVLVVMKAKDMGMLPPLKVKIDPATMLLNGQCWQENEKTNEYDAVDTNGSSCNTDQEWAGG